MKSYPLNHIFPISFVSVACAVILPSCSNSSHLLLYQQSNLGLNAGVNPSTQNLHVRIGLRRQFGAIVPKYAVDETGEQGQAASAFFGSRARITSPFRVPEVAEVMATGRAAVIAAQGGNALDFAEKKEEASQAAAVPVGGRDPDGTVQPPDVTGVIPATEPVSE